MRQLPHLPHCGYGPGGEEIHCRHLIVTGELKVTLFWGEGSKHNAVISWIEISRLLLLG